LVFDWIVALYDDHFVELLRFIMMVTLLL